MAKPKAKEWFLEPQGFWDVFYGRREIRAGRGLATIIDGRAIFSALEEAVAGAQEYVLFAFWSFEMQLALMTKAGRRHGRTWADLLLGTAKRDVRVRVLNSDFDAAFMPGGHQTAWVMYRLLVADAKKASLATASFQMVCARHEAETPANVAAGAGALARYDAIVADLNASDLKRRARIFANSPGLWKIMEWRTKDNSVALKSPGTAFPALPATHHLKLVVVDGRVAYLGGVNLIAKNLDDPRHARQGLPWHDAFVRIEGEPVRDARNAFMAVWNDGRTRCEDFLKEANAASTNVVMPIAATTALTDADLPLAAPDVKKRTVPCQLHRTVSRRGADPQGIPDLERRDVLDGWLKAIGVAQDYIYIENQYFREREIADAIIARHATRAALRVLIVVPLMDEERLTGTPDRLTLHGAALQHEALEEMKKRLGAQLGLFAMKPVKPRPKQDPLIYVHTKVLLVDDVYGNLGSANANPRSFRMDSEVNLAWHDPASVRRLRLELWREQLGSQPGMAGWKPRDFVTRWTRIASRRRRTGFAVPFANDFKGARQLFLPDEFVDLMPAPATQRVA